MAFKEVRGRVITALRSGNFRSEDRDAEKNFLATNRMTAAEVIALLIFCRGDQYKETPHHQIPCNIHIFTPIKIQIKWYIKVYFLSDLGALDEGDPDAMFVSVHPSDPSGAGV